MSQASSDQIEAARARYATDGARIWDREWTRPGYLIKVWAPKRDGEGLTDIGPDAEALARELTARLNASAEREAAARKDEQGKVRAREQLIGQRLNALHVSIQSVSDWWDDAVEYADPMFPESSLREALLIARYFPDAPPASVDQGEE